MRSAGDICQKCKPRWEARKQPSRKLVALPSTTLEHNLEILVCPYCDGSPILEIALANEAE